MTDTRPQAIASRASAAALCHPNLSLGDQVPASLVHLFGEQAHHCGELTEEDFVSFYDIASTIAWIEEGGFSRICLQFPDSLLHHSVIVTRILERPFAAPQKAPLVGDCGAAGRAEGCCSGGACDRGSATSATASTRAGGCCKEPSSSVAVPGAGPSFFLMADSSFAEVEVDEIAAAHVNADAVVHYGRAALGATTRIPVQFVFGKYPVLPELLAKALFPTPIDEVAPLAAGQDSSDDSSVSIDQLPGSQIRLAVFYDVGYAHAIGDIEAAIRTRRPDIACLAVSHLTRSWPGLKAAQAGIGALKCQCDQDASGAASCAACNPPTLSGRIIRVPDVGPGPGDLTPLAPGAPARTYQQEAQAMSRFRALFIGNPEAPTLAQLMLRYNAAVEWLTVDPAQGLLEGGAGLGAATADAQAPLRSYTVGHSRHATPRVLSRRLHLIQRARDALVIVLVLASPSSPYALPICRRLQRLAGAQGRKTYTLVMGQIRPEKLANFLEAEVFVIIGGAETITEDVVGLGRSSAGTGSSDRDYFRPVITPFELEIALGETEWTGNYLLDPADVWPILTNPDAAASKAGPEDDSATGDGSPSGDEDSEDDVYYSLITGRMMRRNRGVTEAAGSAGSRAESASGTVSLELEPEPTDARPQPAGAIELRQGPGALASWSPSTSFLNTRHYQGLEPRIGEHAPVLATEGRRGIAKGYSAEPSHPGASSPPSS
ncbi:hypothetical protein H696_01944 [Fonticula alba]|uniref:Uncharacterized protein n=1 Tax=Fonticula alba TaxID=691883 RepID=A0A058ZAP9_FONAL|nr:hypothetical protein H696_01944 [Fonticula alba]KCV70998.1 hypothetical protein H696_01944 [Fonticula alba]|eukprot:XP_009494121.1 hypothetical protein H696_01944 [Fonticula alba]